MVVSSLSNEAIIFHCHCSPFMMFDVSRKCAFGDACDMVSVQKDGEKVKVLVKHLTCTKI